MGVGPPSWAVRAVLAVAAVAVVAAVTLGVVDGRRGYEVSNVRLAALAEVEPELGRRGPVWRVSFDAEWSAFGEPPVQAQPCTVRLLATDGAILRERGFGLHVGRSDRDISPPFDFPVSAIPDPDRADVVCSRRG